MLFTNKSPLEEKSNGCCVSPLAALHDLCDAPAWFPKAGLRVRRGQWAFRSLRVRQCWSVERTNAEHQTATRTFPPFDYRVFMTAGCPRRGSNWNASNCPAGQRPPLLIWTRASESVGISSNLRPSPVAATAHSAAASRTAPRTHLFTFCGPDMIGLSQSAAPALPRGSRSRPLWNWSGITAISSSLCVPVRIKAGDVTDNFCTEGDLISRATRRKTLS